MKKAVALMLFLGLAAVANVPKLALDTPQAVRQAKIEQTKRDGFLLFVNGMTDRKAKFATSRLLAMDDGDGQDHGPTFPPDPRDYDCGTCPWYYCLLWPFPCL